MLKSYCLLLIFFCINEFATAQQLINTFKLEGKITDISSGTLYLYYLGRVQQIKDSSQIKNGKFEFIGTIDEPTRAYISLKEDIYNELHSTSFYLEPARIKMKIKGVDFNKREISGSITENQQVEIAEGVNKISSKYKSLLDSLKITKDTNELNSINSKLQSYYQELDKWVFNYYLKHPDTYLAPFSFRIRLRNMSYDSLIMFYENMSQKVKESSVGRIFKQDLDLLAGGLPGNYAKDFEKIDIMGVKLNLKDYRGKYVLLDFWASWCIPCRKANPHLIELYSMYKDQGIEFIGISDDDRNPDAWKKAVEKDKLPWKHVLRGLDANKKRLNQRNENDINESYGIHVLPTKVLIDPNGKIIGKFVADEDALEHKLKSIFSSK